MKWEGKIYREKGLDWAKGISQSRALGKLKEIMSVSHQGIRLFTVTKLKCMSYPV